jgi:hypothetical protein
VAATTDGSTEFESGHHGKAPFPFTRVERLMFGLGKKGERERVPTTDLERIWKKTVLP